MLTLCPEISHVVNIIFKVNVTTRTTLCHRDMGTVLLSALAVCWQALQAKSLSISSIVQTWTSLCVATWQAIESLLKSLKAISFKSRGVTNFSFPMLDFLLFFDMQSWRSLRQNHSWVQEWHLCPQFPLCPFTHTAATCVQSADGVCFIFSLPHKASARFL